MNFLKFVKLIIHCILVPREYYEINGEIYVREWLREPVELGYHMRHDHCLSESEINDLLLEARSLLKK